MSLHNIPESDSFTTNVQNPADGDVADASDFETSTLKPLVDRTRWLYNRIKAFWLGGAVFSEEDVTWTIAADKTLKITSEPASDGLLDLSGLFHVIFDRNIIGPLIYGGGNHTGRVPKKMLTLNVSDVGPHTVDSNLYDTVLVSTSSDNTIVQIVNTTPTEGDHVKVVNIGSTYRVTVKNPTGATLVTGLLDQTASCYSMSFARTASGTWQETDSSRRP